MSFLARALVVITSVVAAWRDRFVAAKGARKAAWGCLPFFALCMVCSVLSSALGGTTGRTITTNRPSASVQAVALASTSPTFTPQAPVAPSPTRTAVPATSTPVVPTATVAPTNTPQPTIAPTNTPQPTIAPTNTPQPTATQAPTNTPRPTIAPTNTPQPTNTLVPVTPTATAPPPTPTPGAIQAAAPANAVANAAAGTPARPDDLQQAVVAKVVDGDTVDVSIDGKIERVRLIGINTPETVDPRKPVECFGKEASAKAHELLDGQTIYVEADSSQQERDKYDRLLRYVWLADGQLFNVEMVAQGYAHEYTYSTPYKYQEQFKAAQSDADANDRGLWAPTTCNGQTDAAAASQAPAAPAAAEPNPTALAPAASAPAAPTEAVQAGGGGGGPVPPVSKHNCPADHPVKGNQSGIYHTPDSRSYKQTDPEECFATAADALAAGYRAPKR